ncbi:ribosomal large subunit pseudouridine synthase D [Alphaproteobacteria bacterium]|nr:ribosomal large subunit pseudouridine synthase D [Alphaproteobacteria bacterium]
MRLDAYLAKVYSGQSRSTWAKVIERGFVTVNGGVETSTKKQVSDKDKIVADESYDKKIATVDFPVIFEDDNVIVIDKPAGVLTHSKGALNEEFTVADYVASLRAQRSNPAKSEKKPGLPRHSAPRNDREGIVHRLDRGTSGVIIGAKNEETTKMLQRQFQDRKTKKTYLALVNITPTGRNTLDKNGENFTIDLPIGRNPKKPSQFKVDSKGKDAITDVKVVRVFENSTTLLELKPHTGRTHQLRVHLSYIGLPIVGDPVYGVAETASERMMLHASQLEITIPDGQRKVFRAELPEGFDEKPNHK